MSDPLLDCCDLNRRRFLQTGFGGIVGLVLASRMNLPLLAQETPAGGRKRARACILLWMAGGPSQIDTWDPKPGKETGGEFKEIPTTVPGIRISEHLPRIAQQMKHLALIRSMTSREGNHDRGTKLVHTGFTPQVTAEFPSLGATISSEIGKSDFDLPNFISVSGPSIGSGFLGPKHSPFVIQNPLAPPENLYPAGGLDPKLLDDRMALMAESEKEFAATHGSSESEAHQEVYAKAVRMMKSPLAKAFNLSEEKEALRREYGSESKFGQGCLMARRLVEAGVPFVEVTLNGWDTHQDNFTRTKSLMGELDPGFATLVKDLSERGILDETLVIWMGEFGRTPKINGNAGRDHFPKAWSAVLAGGGVNGGKVIGSTDATGNEVKDRPVQVKDLFATVADLFGIDGTKKNIAPNGRPHTIVDEGAQVVKELYA
ncbi:MAG: DUF1501 domain-containing protein [Planctomycetes bacterium]|nr:DUF1501 domain-containing protein [Planctomycetota bacterium]